MRCIIRIDNECDSLINCLFLQHLYLWQEPVEEWGSLCFSELHQSFKSLLMYNSHYEMVYNQVVDGIKIKYVKKEDSEVMTEFELEKGTKLPEHLHLSNHSGYLLKGSIRIIADGIVSDFKQGDSWTINKHICHTTEAMEDSVVLEVFNIEQEYAELDENQNVQVAGYYEYSCQ